MKHLFLLRHAEAEINPSVQDIDRALTALGESSVSVLGQKLEGRDVNFDLILCSPSLRARATCQLLLTTLEMKNSFSVEESFYNASYVTLLNRVKAFHNQLKNVLIVGHNPGISELANFFLDPLNRQLSFGTANMAEIELNSDIWSDIKENCGTVRFFV